MSSALIKGLRRSLRPTARRVRMHGGSPEEVAAGMEWWKKVTLASVPVVGVALAINLYLEMAHHAHDEEGPVYVYSKIRNKPYPWGKGDCNFFDLKCRRNE
uniref:Uncharacterized protein n=1 Tax=Lotharella oceanica TaxID=641309 RepID=A0A7S2THI6_9EUKA|mmetsp:Transcript_11760/g.22657  ORF Transcript_11760/g.22657 Transcript_11760/m.22657 type:complete len:101 (+) Transcript_11760:125-427(+)|eukprot:CAMPEP_0170181316 /NCGR_PEP_ID=MMETSP0040_2-20121228/24774_1 /TAXON_ID=641309 /ORGANISM="Lotharella oceanica, Strain CCMP622" /LENGTH=100 /DNA_ID=CAMNT_0010426317 /DNA_START=64 /DNA_END=366 /DNA_ORIENTATION=-